MKTSLYIYAAVVVFIMLLAASPSYAERGDITVHTVSAHVGVGGLNNINPGLAYDVTNYLRVGALLNSYEKPSAYGAVMWHVHPRVSVGVGAISGYQFKDGHIEGKTNSVVPLLAVEGRITKHTAVVWMGNALNLELKF